MKAWNDLDHHPAAPALEVHRRAFVRGPQLGESVLRRPNFEMLQEPSADPLASPIGPDNHALQPRRSIAALVDVEFAKTDSSDARTVCINGDEGDRKAFRSRLAPRDLDPPLPVRGLRRMSPLLPPEVAYRHHQVGIVRQRADREFGHAQASGSINAHHRRLPSVSWPECS